MADVLVLTGYGINCEEETRYAFELAGLKADIVHINELINKEKKLSDYQILAFPGGFSYGDDTGSGNALANKIRNNIMDDLKDFVSGDNLAIGICNGFQVMVNLGLIPAIGKSYGLQQVALMHNESARYIDRWVDLEFSGKSPWIKDVGRISVPIAHGEGRFYAPDEVIRRLDENGQVSARYVDGDICRYQLLAANPNGSLNDIASITDESGRLIGMMPHPERAMDFTQLPNWPLLKQQFLRSGKAIPKEGPGRKIFQNAAAYYR